MDGWMDDDDGGGDDDDVEGQEKDDEDDNDHNHDDTDQKKEEEGDGAGDENMTRTNEEDLWQWETDATMKTYKTSLKQIKTSQSHFKVLHFFENDDQVSIAPRCWGKLLVPSQRVKVPSWDKGFSQMVRVFDTQQQRQGAASQTMNCWNFL